MPTNEPKPTTLPPSTVDVTLGSPTTIGAHVSDEEDDSNGEKDRNFVTALARGMELLRCFSMKESVLGNQELAAKTGLPKATVSRMTYTLSQLGYLRKHAQSGKYKLDVGVLSFGYQMLSNLPIRAIATSFMVDLAQHAHAAVALAAGLHASRIDGSPLVYNCANPLLPDLLICRPELAEQVREAVQVALGNTRLDIHG